MTVNSMYNISQLTEYVQYITVNSMYSILQLTVVSIIYDTVNSMYNI